MLSRHTPTPPQFLRDWRVLPIALVIGALLAALGVAVFSNDKTEAATEPTQETATSVPAPSPRDWKAEEDLTRLQEWLDMYRTGYDCPANDGVTRPQDLVLCPDYTLVIKFDQNKPTKKPELTIPRTADGLTPITVSVEYIHSCGNDGVESLPIMCSHLWHVIWKVDNRFVPLGCNTEQKSLYREDGSHWTGPMGFDWPDGDALFDPTNTTTIEVYAGDPRKQLSSTPLPADKEGPRYVEPTQQDEYELTA